MVISVLLVLLQLDASGQEDTLKANPHQSGLRSETGLCTVPDKDYFKSWINDGRDIIIAPSRWNKYQWIAFSGVVAGTAVLMTQDASIQSIVLNNQNKFMDWISANGLERFGSGIYSLPALGILYGVGAITKNDKARYTALKGFEAYVFGFVAAQS